LILGNVLLINQFSPGVVIWLSADKEREMDEKICSICGDVFSEEDDRDFIDSSDTDDDLLGIPREACPECKKEIRTGSTELLGDFSDLHPDETDEEFWEHEE
jgi:hypothetical protein